MTRPSRWPWIAPILLYAASALEMIIMVTPFAAYSYSVYTPLFHGLEQSAVTAWLPQFFLPHLAHTKIPLFRWVNWLGAALALIGIIGFLACAVQLYYGKFIRKQLVNGGLYGRVRHPQYLMLIVAGAGLLLLWPRFFILVTYLMMLGLYYILARHEEQVIRDRYGAAADGYLARVPMFNPFRRPRPAGAGPASRPNALRAWFAVVAISMVLAFGLRTIAVSQLYVVARQAPNVTALAFREMSDSAIEAVAADVLATSAVRALLRADPDTPLYLQINDGRSQLVHLLIDLGMTPEARDAIDAPNTGYLVVVSRVTGRDPGIADAPDVFSLGARITPLLLVGPPDDDGDAPIVGLTADQFYPGFARILF